VVDKPKAPVQAGRMDWDRLRFVTGRTARYGAVSLVCFIANNLLLIGFDRLGIPLWLNIAISVALMILLGFVLQISVTFSAPLSWRALARYTLVMLPNVPAAFVLLWLLRDQLHMPMHYAAPIVTTVMLIWNGLGSIWALARRKSQV
jgi:hypothetical protein